MFVNGQASLYVIFAQDRSRLTLLGCGATKSLKMPRQMASFARPTLLHPVVRDLFILLRDQPCVPHEAFLAGLDELELRVQDEGAPLSTIEAIASVRLMAVQQGGSGAEIIS